MKVTHTLTATATCPEDGATITYKVVCHVNRFQPTCETAEAVKLATAEPVYQEDLTVRLARSLGCVVKTWGTHQGVMVECEAGPSDANSGERGDGNAPPRGGALRQPPGQVDQSLDGQQC